MLAAPAVNGEEIVHSQEPLFQRADGVDEEMISQSREFREQMFAILKQEQDRKMADEKLRGIFGTYFSQLTPDQKKIAERYYGPMDGQIKFFNSASFRYWLTFDPISVLKQVNISVLAINGELDFVVTPEQNLRRIGTTFEDMSHQDFTIMRLPHLNHAFQTCQTGSMAEYASIEETVSPIVLKTMADWILKKTAQKN